MLSNKGTKKYRKLTNLPNGAMHQQDAPDHSHRPQVSSVITNGGAGYSNNIQNFQVNSKSSNFFRRNTSNQSNKSGSKNTIQNTEQEISPHQQRVQHPFQYFSLSSNPAGQQQRGADQNITPNSAYKQNHHAGHQNERSPNMPGNGNSQINYQQRKSLKKTASNEISYKANPTYMKGGSIRTGSVNSSQNDPVKQYHHQGTPLSQNYISQLRPTSGNNMGGGIIQQPGHSQKSSNQQGHPSHHGQQAHFNNQQYRSNNINNMRSSPATYGSGINQKGYQTAGQKSTSGQQVPNQISQEQLQEQIQKLIKNNKKHFSKDQGTEELHKYLKQVLHQYLDNNGNQQFPQGNDKQGFNDLINELIRINQPGGGAGGAGTGPGRIRTGKDRAHSEKIGTANAQTASQGYHVHNPSQPHAGIHNQQHHAHGTPSYLQNKAQNLNNQNTQGHHGPHGPGSIPQQSINKSPLMNGSKKMKVQKPTINLSINNNVQNVIVTPGQYSNRNQNTHGTHNSNVTSGPYASNQGGHAGNPQPSGLVGNLNGGQVNPSANHNSGTHLIVANTKQKRTSSEDNVNVQQKASSKNQQAQQQQYQQQQQYLQQQQQSQYQASNAIYPQRHGHAGAIESPVVKHRKNLPSLNNADNSSAHGGPRTSSKGGGSRGISNDSSVPMAIQIQNSQQNTQFSNQSGFLPGSRENSQASSGKAHGSSSNQKSYLEGAAAINLNQINANNTSNSNQNPNSLRNSASGYSAAQPSTTATTTLKGGSGNTSSSNVAAPTSGKPTTRVDDTILQERDQLIKYVKQYIKKNNELPPTTLNFYKFVKLIGKGAFGKVTLGIHKLTGKQVAIKTIEKNYMQDDFSKRKVFQEVYLLKKIKHSNVIRLLEVFESSKHLLMVMEYAGGGDLLRLIKRKGKLQESDAKFIFKQIAYGLAHIHCRSVIHRDIKLDNILLDCEKGVKICDFGVSKIIKKGQVIQEQCGTPAYLAPEIIIDKGYEGFFVDVWSLGVLLFAMLCGTVPFKASNLEDLHKLILKGEFTFPNELTTEAQALVRGMILLEPRARLTVPEILSHAWLKETNEDESDEEEDNAEEDKDGKNTSAVAGGQGTKKENDIDLKNIQGNVNYVNVDNLFYHENYKIKLSYTDYCCITEDFSTENIDEEALTVCENFGFPRQFLVKCLNRGDINHATACYYLLTNAG